MKPGVVLPLLFALLALPTTGTGSWADSRMAPFRIAAENGDGNGNINIIVRQVSFTPAFAHVGETIRIEVVIEDVDEGYRSMPSQVLANGKRVASRLFTFGWSKGNRVYRETFLWDTKGAAPGEYKIKADYFLQEDSSQFDNEMTVTRPLVLVPAGAPLQEGKPGDTATETDPRWKAGRAGG